MKKKSILLFFIRLLKLFLSLISVSLTAHFFGVSIEKDTWLLSISIIIFIDLAIWGPVNETFRTKFIYLKKQEGELKALNKVKSLLFFITLISIVIVINLVLFPEIVINIFSSSYSETQRVELTKMIKIVAPVLLFTQLSAILTSILNAYDSFITPEISAIATAIVNIIVILIFAPYVGIYSLVISYYLSYVLLLLLLFRQISKLNINFYLSNKEINFRDFKLFFVFALPFFFPYFFGQISTIIEKLLVSSIGIGNLSLIDYSRKFSDILNNVLTSVLVTILVPILSQNFIEKEKKLFVNNFFQIFQLGMIFLSFIIPFFVLNSKIIVNIFFDMGKIDTIRLLEISNLTVFYGLTSFSIFFYLVFGMALMTSNNRKKYAFWGIVAQVLSILMNYSLIDYYGIYIFPISLFTSHLFVGVIMCISFPFKTKSFYFTITKYLFLFVVIVVLSIIANNLIENSLNPFIQFFITSFLILVLILLLLLLFNLEEKRIITNYLQKNNE